MGSAVHWVLEVSIKDGEFDNFKSVMHDLVESSRAEPGTTHYEWFVSADQKICHVYERYVDSAGAMAHVATFGEKFAPRLLAAVDPTRFVVYGSPDDAVRGVLDGFGAVYMGQIGGFAR
jgi:quinol monooxygenase YgiN